MKLRHWVALALLGVGVTGSLRAEPIVIRFSHTVEVNTPKGKAAEYFKQLVEMRSMGKIKVQVFPDSQLYKDKEELNALLGGSVQMIAPSLSKLEPLGIKAFQIFDLPYLFDNYDEVHRVTYGALGRQMLSQLEPKGVMGLGFWDNGFRQMSANRPLHGIADYAGLRMRIQSSRVLDLQMKTLGAVPKVMNFSDVYDGLKNGTIDGAENTYSNFQTQKLYEVQRHLTITNHGYLGYAVLMNKKFWDGLGAENQEIIRQSMSNATNYANMIADDENREALAKIRATGKTQIYALTAEEKKALKNALVSVHDQVDDKVGLDLIQKIYRLTGFDPIKR